MRNDNNTNTCIYRIHVRIHALASMRTEVNTRWSSWNTVTESESFKLCRRYRIWPETREENGIIVKIISLSVFQWIERMLGFLRRRNLDEIRFDQSPKKTEYCDGRERVSYLCDCVNRSESRSSRRRESCYLALLSIEIAV